MRALALFVVAALATSPAVQMTTCRCADADSAPACCCGDACTGDCCCGGEEGSRAESRCVCKDTPPRAVERPDPDAPAIVATAVVADGAARPAPAARAATPREAPTPVPGFRAPLLL